MLPSFEISNFRTFKHLHIERLGRVNLIVGKNNVGKTTLLEALRFYAMRSSTALREYLVDHDEVRRYGISNEAQLDFRSLFHGRPRERGEAYFGPLDRPEERLAMRLTNLEVIEYSDGRRQLEPYEDEDEEVGTGVGEIVKGVIFLRDGKPVIVTPEPTQRSLGQGRYVGPALVSARGVSDSDLVQWWDDISLTGGDKRVVSWLSLMVRADGIAAIEDPVRGGRRMFKALVSGQKEPVPLKSLGDGSYRLFQLATAIEYAFRASWLRQVASSDQLDEENPGGSDFVLIDEIENGVHHTVHIDLWKSVLSAAREHDLQIFATTHSNDCLLRFAEAIAADEKADGQVVRLERDKNEEATRAIVIDRQKLPIVARDAIEVR